MSAKKTSAGRTSKTALKALSPKNRRKLLSSWRIVKYGLANFFRNAWLSLAATAIMVITLTIIAVTVVVSSVMVNTIDDIKSKVDMSIYVKQDIKKKDVTTIKSALEDLNTVVSVNYITPEQSRDDFAVKNSDNADVLAALDEATNKFPGIFNIKMTDIDDTSELEKLVKNNATIQKNLDTDNPPSFSSSRRQAIDNISRTMGFVQQVGMIAGVIFLIIASLIIFNTIRMAIFNRRDEIYMMKLIGANKTFIRGPFIVEAVQYGLLAALVTVVIITTVLVFAKNSLVEYGIAVEPTYNLLAAFWPLAVLALILIGTTIGVVSSLLATRKYLKLT